MNPIGCLWAHHLHTPIRSYVHSDCKLLASRLQSLAGGVLCVGDASGSVVALRLLPAAQQQHAADLAVHLSVQAVEVWR